MYKLKSCKASKLTGSGVRKQVFLKTVSQGWVAFPGTKVLSAEKEVLGTKPYFTDQNTCDDSVRPA